uniref:Uncharacterized protein n=1 Tax=Romanomermis culicivorax TaxID=13658 RepID=A0A915HUD4_ROMCU
MGGTFLKLADQRRSSVPLYIIYGNPSKKCQKCLFFAYAVHVCLAKDACFKGFCEDTVYEIKTRKPSDIYSSGSNEQCAPSNRSLLKLLVPSDAQWFKIGTPVMIFSEHCKSFMTNDLMENAKPLITEFGPFVPDNFFPYPQ